MLHQDSGASEALPGVHIDAIEVGQAILSPVMGAFERQAARGNLEGESGGGIWDNDRFLEFSGDILFSLHTTSAYAEG